MFFLPCATFECSSFRVQHPTFLIIRKSLRSGECLQSGDVINRRGASCVSKQMDLIEPNIWERSAKRQGSVQNLDDITKREINNGNTTNVDWYHSVNTARCMPRMESCCRHHPSHRY
jgi:hypothetical protein